MKYTVFTMALMLPTALAAQSPASRESPDRIMVSFETFADRFGSRLVTAFDSIPEGRYDYRPTTSQQTIGYIAQHLEDANYDLCELIGDLKHPTTAKDSLSDTVKARWPKDTLVARLKASLHFCDAALERVVTGQLPIPTNALLAFETDLAEHYSQISVYMRLLGMVPPSALRRQLATVNLPASALSPYVGVYQLIPGLEFDLTMRDGALFVRSTAGGDPAKLWPESSSTFYVREADADITFTRGARGAVTGLVVHQYGRDRPAAKIH